MTTAQLKLTAALPEGARATARRISARFHLDPVGWFQSKHDARHLPALADAAWNEKRAEFRYRRWNDIVARKVMPLGLVLKGGVWYLVAQVSDQANDQMSAQPRTYKVANIDQLVVRDERFERPKDFDLAGFWTTASRAYEAGLYRHKAELRVSPLGLKRLDMLGSAVAHAAAETASRLDRDGWVRVTIPIESFDHAAHELIRLGNDVEVLSPPDLRRNIAKIAHNLLRLYRAS